MSSRAPSTRPSCSKTATSSRWCISSGGADRDASALRRAAAILLAMRRAVLLQSAVLWAPLAAACAPTGSQAEPQPVRSAEPVDANALLEGDAALRRKIDEAVRARGPSYVPRTRHTHPDGSPRYVNRL